MNRRPPSPQARGSAAAATSPGRGRGRSPRAARTPAVRPPARGPGDLVRLVSVRAMALGVVGLIAFAIVFPTVRAYLGQRATLDALAAEVAAAEAREDQLFAELARWEADAYVIAQARERLSYVMPGETAYRVIDPEVVVEETHVSSADPGSDTGLALPVGGAVAPWYTTIWDSVALAGEAPLPEGTEEPATTDQPTTDQPSTDQPSTDQPSTDQPSTGTGVDR